MSVIPDGVWLPAPIDLISYPSWRVLVKFAALKTRVRVDDVLSRNRRKNIVATRYHAMWLVMTHCQRVSLPKIGRLFDRDHTTVIHGIRTHKLRIAGDRAAPFFWSDEAIERATVLYNNGAHDAKVMAKLGVNKRDLQMMPGRQEAKQQYKARSRHIRWINAGVIGATGDPQQHSFSTP